MIPTTVWIFGGRDVGKTTIAMHTAAELRWMGIPTVLTYGSAQLWGEVSPIVNMRIFARDLRMFTPHEAAELCRDSLNFLILRRKDYAFAPAGKYREAWIAVDGMLEDTLRAGHVEYKSLPGVRASTQYLIKKICERVGYDR